MQLLFISSIIFAIAAVSFAFQNDTPVTVSLGAYYLDSSLAVVLLITLGVGALIASLISTPAMIGNQAAAALLRRKVESLEERNLVLENRVRELERLQVAPKPVEPMRVSTNPKDRPVLLQRGGA